MTDTRLLYVTVGDRDEALALARTLVDERLVACANLLDGMRSVYRWEGEVHEDDEVVLVAKTAADRVDAVVARVGELHSYDCPCVVALPIVAGAAPFLAWVAEQTRG